MRIAGIDIGGSTTKLGIFETERGLVCSEQVPTITADASAMVREIARLLARHRPLDFVGVGTAGSVNIQTGLVNASNLAWRGVPLRELLQAHTGLPVWVDNDAQAALTAEWHDGACKGAETAVYLTLGTGIGGALILGGRPWRGHNNTAVEIGHMVTHADGLPCNCSRRGCFEMYASARALSAFAGGAPARQVIERAREGDAAMRSAFGAYVHELGIGLTTLIVLFKPQAIVLGGGISEAGELLIDGVNNELRVQFAKRPEDFMSIVHIAQHRNQAGVIGAAILAKLHFAQSA